MSSKINWVLRVESVVYKFLRKIPERDARRVLFVIESFTNDPFAGDIQKMKGEENIWRRRIGSYRIFYEIHTTKKVIYVLNVERRTSSTY